MCKRNAELNQQAMKLMVDDGVKKEMTKGKEEKKEPNLEKEQAEAIKGKVKDKDMEAALKVAQEAERLEEEEFMRKAIEESQKLEEEQKNRYQQEEDEEMKMIQQAIEMSKKEEEARV